MQEEEENQSSVSLSVLLTTEEEGVEREGLRWNDRSDYRKLNLLVIITSKVYLKRLCTL